MTETLIPIDSGTARKLLALAGDEIKARQMATAAVGHMLDEMLAAEALDDIEKGHVISHERIASWLESWGMNNELPPPSCS